jgi:hypothetical protein
MGAISLAIEAAKERAVKVRILVPYNEEVEDKLMLKVKELGRKVRREDEEELRPIYNADILSTRLKLRLKLQS